MNKTIPPAALRKATPTMPPVITKCRATTAHTGVEWLTLSLIIGGYVVWLLALWIAGTTNLMLGLALAAVACTFHSSLQHEALHGHPTRSARFNEALVCLPIGLAYPYRRFKTTHLRHHCDANLTDPHDDPESWFVAEGDWFALSLPMRILLRVNATLAGRLIFGPALAFTGFVRNDLRLIRAGDRGVADAWVRHAMGAVPVLAVVWMVAGVSPWLYVMAVAYPALSLLMLRTFAEHRAETENHHRSVLVEASKPLALLFLNNNLHALHHQRPALAWYKLPEIYRAERDHLVASNGGYVFKGYRAVFRKYGLRPINGIVHPFLRRSTPPT